MNKEAFCIFIKLLVYAATILFFVSPDSCTHDLFDRMDSSVFFACGRAWMNGMTPYADFADSKGPLLWLIYGCGYLISRTNYIGVYVLSCLSYGIVFYYTFKISKIFLKGDDNSFLCALLMGFSYFNVFTQNEIRAEDFCLPFILISLYQTCRVLYDNPNPRSIYLSFCILGGCTASVLLIKYNVSLMFGCLYVFMAYEVYKRHLNIWFSHLALFVGVLVVILPFFVYFSIIGCWNDFIREYFVNTMKTMQNLREENIYSPSLLFIIKAIDNISIIFWVLFSILVPIIIKYMNRYTLFPLVSGLFFLLVTNIYSRYYYFIVCTPFLLFGVIGIVYMLKDHITFQGKKMGVCVAIALVAVCSLLHIRYWHLSDQRFNSSAFFTQLKNNPIREEFYFNANLIKSKTKPKILYLRGTDVGYGILAESLPACRYWIRQNGETEEMFENQYITVKKRLADVIVVKRNNSEDIVVCQQAGYAQHEYNSQSSMLIFIKQ